MSLFVPVQGAARHDVFSCPILMGLADVAGVVGPDAVLVCCAVIAGGGDRLPQGTR